MLKIKRHLLDSGSSSSAVSRSLVVLSILSVDVVALSVRKGKKPIRIWASHGVNDGLDPKDGKNLPVRGGASSKLQGVSEKMPNLKFDPSIALCPAVEVGTSEQMKQRISYISSESAKNRHFVKVGSQCSLMKFCRNCWKSVKFKCRWCANQMQARGAPSKADHKCNLSVRKQGFHRNFYEDRASRGKEDIGMVNCVFWQHFNVEQHKTFQILIPHRS
ncbi:hypothetical protein TSMEX_011229 [Taenia solium]|eukprot:TsM_000153700 transcript=TsM_000153700 gene=TsM_000153700